MTTHSYFREKFDCNNFFLWRSQVLIRFYISKLGSSVNSFLVFRCKRATITEFLFLFFFFRILNFGSFSDESQRNCNHNCRKVHSDHNSYYHFRQTANLILSIPFFSTASVFSISVIISSKSSNEKVFSRFKYIKAPFLAKAGLPECASQFGSSVKSFLVSIRNFRFRFGFDQPEKNHQHKFQLSRSFTIQQFLQIKVKKTIRPAYHFNSIRHYQCAFLTKFCRYRIVSFNQNVSSYS